MISRLSLKIDDNTNPETLIVKDTSWYNPDIPVTGAMLQITLPGFNHPIDFNVNKDFDIVLNSNTLGLTLSLNNQPYIELPDGIYIYKYSICPKDRLWVEYNLFRVNSIMKRYHNLLCKSIISSCSFTIKDKDKINEIKNYIDIAKATTDYCGNNCKATELYNYADELLSKYENSCECYG